MSRHSNAAEEAGQQHILSKWSELSDTEKAALDQQLDTLNLRRMNEIFAGSLETHNKALSSEITPPKASDVIHCENADEAAKFWNAGLQLVADGHCAVVVLAGGQGSRLGTSFPKGMLDPELPSKRTLFELHVSKIKKVERLAANLFHNGNELESGKIVFFVMTSDATDVDTRAFFSSNNNFGLENGQVQYFKQSSMPCFTEDGKIIMETPSKVAVAPGGNGGFYAAIGDEEPMRVLKSRGIKYVQVFTVDNILCRVADPYFFGACVVHNLDAAAKSTPKVNAQEAVGVFSIRDGKVGVIEYSEIGSERASRKSANGELEFNCSNIAIHAYSIPFLEQCAEIMKSFNVYHVAKKDINSINGKVKGIKLEAFIFDLFQFADNFKVVQVKREKEFSPIKNATTANGTDNSATAKQALNRLHRQWLQDKGVNIEPHFDLSKELPVDAPVVEIDAKISYCGEGLDNITSLIGQTVFAPAFITM